MFRNAFWQGAQGKENWAGLGFLGERRVGERSGVASCQAWVAWLKRAPRLRASLCGAPPGPPLPDALPKAPTEGRAQRQGRPPAPSAAVENKFGRTEDLPHWLELSKGGFPLPP